MSCIPCPRWSNWKMWALLPLTAVLSATSCPAPATTGGPTNTTTGGNSPFPKTADWTSRVVDDNAARRPVDVAIADFDADALADVAVAYAGDDTTLPAVFIFFQVNPDTWVAVQPRVDPGLVSLAGIAALAVGDIDGDSRLDLVLAINGRLVYLRGPLNPRDGSAWIATIFDQSFASGIGQWNDVAIGNIDGAAGPDLVACGSLPGRLAWFRSPSAGPMSGVGWVRFDIDIATRTGAASVSLRDMDGDGRTDIVSTAPGEMDDRVAWYGNPPDLATDRWTKHPIGNLADATRLAVADLNADGRFDVIVTSPTLRQIGWYPGPVDPAAAWSGFLLTQYSSATPVDIQVADIDGNGQPDVVVPTRQPGSLRWFTPLGSQTDVWVENNLRDTTEDMSRIAISDIDPGMRPDVAAPLRASDTALDQIVWLQNPE